MVRPIKTIEKKLGKIRIVTSVDQQTYDNFEKNTNKAIAISIDRAKDIARDMFKKMKKDPNKQYTINLQYKDIWRASKTFKDGDEVKFPGDTVPKDYNKNTDLFDYVYGIQIVERTPAN